MTKLQTLLAVIEPDDPNHDVVTRGLAVLANMDFRIGEIDRYLSVLFADTPETPTAPLEKVLEEVDRHLAQAWNYGYDCGAADNTSHPAKDAPVGVENPYL